MNAPTPASPPLVATDSALAEWLARWRAAPWLAIDTEFVREETYYPQLCLLQIGDGRDSVCVDPLAQLDLAPLYALLADPALGKVFHAAGQDLEIFVRETGGCPAPLFDTQVAAALLGYGDQLGYSGLVEKLGGQKVDKSLARTNWARRPLTAPELNYAADDVRHLAVLYPRLEAALRERGRLSWLQEDCARMTDPRRYRPDPAREWERLKGLVRLEPAAQHVAAALATWRDVLGEQRNRPRKWILSDDALYRIAERRPQSRAQLEGLQVVPPKTIERHGEALLRLVAETPAGAGPLARDDRLDETTKARLKRLGDRLRAIAAELDVPASLIAPRADLEKLAHDGEQADAMVLRGWRREVAGAELLKLVS